MGRKKLIKGSTLKCTKQYYRQPSSLLKQIASGPYRLTRLLGPVGCRDTRGFCGYLYREKDCENYEPKI